MRSTSAFNGYSFTVTCFPSVNVWCDRGWVSRSYRILIEILQASYLLESALVDTQSLHKWYWQGYPGVSKLSIAQTSSSMNHTTFWESRRTQTQKHPLVFQKGMCELWMNTCSHTLPIIEVWWTRLQEGYTWVLVLQNWAMYNLFWKGESLHQD